MTDPQNSRFGKLGVLRIKDRVQKRGKFHDLDKHGLDLSGVQQVRELDLSELKKVCPDARCETLDEYRKYIVDAFGNLKRFGIAFDFEIDTDTHSFPDDVRLHKEIQPKLVRQKASPSNSRDVLTITYTKVDKIDSSLDHSGQEEYVERLLELSENLFSYGEHTIRETDGPLLWDISKITDSKINQFVYETIPQSAKSRFYLVDLDPYMDRNPIRVRDFFNRISEMGVSLIGYANQHHVILTEGQRRRLKNLSDKFPIDSELERWFSRKTESRDDQESFQF